MMQSGDLNHIDNLILFVKVVDCCGCQCILKQMLTVKKKQHVFKKFTNLTGDFFIGVLT